MSKEPTDMMDETGTEKERLAEAEQDQSQQKSSPTNFNSDSNTTSDASSEEPSSEPVPLPQSPQSETETSAPSLSLRPKLDFSTNIFGSSATVSFGKLRASSENPDSDSRDKANMEDANNSHGKQQPVKSIFTPAKETFVSKPIDFAAAFSMGTPPHPPTPSRQQTRATRRAGPPFFGATPSPSAQPFAIADIRELAKSSRSVTFSPSTTSVTGERKMAALAIPPSVTFGDPNRLATEISSQTKKQNPKYESVSESSGEERDTERENTSSTTNTSIDSDHESELERMILKQHLSLLEKRADTDELDEIKSAPLFTEPVRKYARALAKGSFSKPFSQYGLLGGDISGNGNKAAEEDPRIYWNIAAPSSFFICGSQGSGKSHHLSCLLENALAPCSANTLPRPLTGILFHYDTFSSDTGGSPCEAAWLSTNRNIKVRVLCPPTNIGNMKRMYRRFPDIQVQELRLNEANLDTKRMLNLMCVSANGTMPLYMSVVNRILRELRVSQQSNDLGFDYTEFKKRLSAEPLTEAQIAPLKQRIDTLESFMVDSQAKTFELFAGRGGGGYGYAPPRPIATPKSALKSSNQSTGIDWSPKHGTLTIVDLSCPCVTSEMACSLFNICLSLFLEQDSTSVGRVVALDEAHKYMNESPECQMLTQALLETIRLQRHLGARILISTQEPTISPKLLDLCSVTAVHRFTSPAWLNVLHKHIAGVSKGAEMFERAARLTLKAAAASADDNEVQEEVIDGVGTLSLQDAGGHGSDPLMDMFSKIVSLKVGEALIFAPSAVIGVKKRVKDGKMTSVGVQRLTHGALKVRIRNRTTMDGGKSIMAA